MDHRELAEILLKRSYHERDPHEEPFVLASGKKSWHYFECQRTTSWAEALPLVGAAFYGELDSNVLAVGGLTRGADPIADAIAYYSAVTQPRTVNTFSVRKVLKEHGTKNWIEGSAVPGDRVALVDDVVTSGGSVINAARRCIDEELKIAQVLVLVDREEGGLSHISNSIAKMAGGQVPVRALFMYSELQALYRELIADGHRLGQPAGRV